MSIESKIAEFKPISLSDMDAVKLLNRTDTKFLFSKAVFEEIMSELSNHYQSLDINGGRMARYKTLYFDTPNNDFYFQHHQGKPNRFKVRIRKYVDSDLCFLEVKNKRKGKTFKSRIVIEDFEEVLSEKSKAFIAKAMGEEVPLEAVLWNSFKRITLVNNELKERLTIDTALSFQWKDKDPEFENSVIAELKQENLNRKSPFYSLMKTNYIRPLGISKYCLGRIVLSDMSIKHNNFKPKVKKVYQING